MELRYSNSPISGSLISICVSGSMIINDDILHSTDRTVEHTSLLYFIERLKRSFIHSDGNAQFTGLS